MTCIAKPDFRLHSQSINRRSSMLVGPIMQDAASWHSSCKPVLFIKRVLPLTLLGLLQAPACYQILQCTVCNLHTVLNRAPFPSSVWCQRLACWRPHITDKFSVLAVRHFIIWRSMKALDPHPPSFQGTAHLSCSCSMNARSPPEDSWHWHARRAGIDCEAHVRPLHLALLCTPCSPCRPKQSSGDAAKATALAGAMTSLGLTAAASNGCWRSHSPLALSGIPPSS